MTFTASLFFPLATPATTLFNTFFSCSSSWATMKTFRIILPALLTLTSYLEHWTTTLAKETNSSDL